MKNIYSKNEFLSAYKEDEMINEGILSWFKNLWKSINSISNRIKGSKEINIVYDKYIKLVDQAFAKIGNVGAAEGAAKVANPAVKPAAVKPATTTETTVKPEDKIVDNMNVTDIESAIYEADAAVAPNPEKQNTEEQKNLVNLTPEKIAKVAKLTEDRITELKTQFENEVNIIVKKLTKDPQYSSDDELNQFAVVKKNEFNSAIYDKWYNIYQKAGDQKKMIELTKVKKENDAKLKQSLDLLNTKIGEKQKVLQVKPTGKYKYHSTTTNTDITVEVIGKALGQDESGAEDTTNTEHKTMWKVKSEKNETFWVAPTALKEEIGKKQKPQKPQQVKKENIKVGNTFSYTPNGQNTPVTVKVVDADGKGVPTFTPTKDGDNQVAVVTTDNKKTPYAPRISRLTPIKK